jgi:hypothetical protein
MALGGCWHHGMASADINIPWVCDAERVVSQTGDCGDNVKALSERSRPGRSAKSRGAKDELTETPGNFVGPLCVAAPGRWLTMCGFRRRRTLFRREAERRSGLKPDTIGA